MNKNDKIKIFLVDDDPMFVQSLKHSLKEEKTEIKIFSTGEACLKGLEKETPQVVVLDYYLNTDHPSALNGIQIMNRIKHSTPDTEVIMLSAQNDVNIAMDTLKYGAYDYIAKDRNAFIELKNDIRHITATYTKTYSFNKESRRLKLLNLIIILLVILLFIISKIL